VFKQTPEKKGKKNEKKEDREELENDDEYK
jgi:hypothetical protein